MYEVALPGDTDTDFGFWSLDFGLLRAESKIKNPKSKILRAVIKHQHCVHRTSDSYVNIIKSFLCPEFVSSPAPLIL
jgi:hypothetical protein